MVYSPSNTIKISRSIVIRLVRQSIGVLEVHDTASPLLTGLPPHAEAVLVLFIITWIVEFVVTNYLLIPLR